MGKTARILVAIIIILSFVLLGRNAPAWAASGANSPAAPAVERSTSADNSSRCDKDRKPSKTNCEDEDDDDDDGEQEGTVKPPRHRVKACSTGQYSLGGIATFEVKKLGRKDCVNGSTKPYDRKVDPRLPKGAQVLTDLVSLKLPKDDAKVRLCFAAPPGKGVKIYVISHGRWESVGGGGKNGQACVETSKSGTFALIRT